ncbi:MAG: hypothetical protein ACC645_20010 [Pirellulales bacterium]
MPRSRLLLALLMVATLLVDAAACRLAKGQNFPDPAMVLLMALAFSQIGLMAMWLTFGTAHYLLRTAALIAGIVAWSHAIDLALASWALGDLGRSRIVSASLSLQAVITVLFSIPVRWTGVVWSSSAGRHDAPVGAITGHVQFTVSRLLGWTTVTAMVATLARYYVVLPPSEHWLESGFLLLGSAVAVLGGTYVGSTLRHAVPKLAMTILICALTVGATIHDRAGPYVTLYVLETLFALVWVTVSRAAGFAIHRVEMSPGGTAGSPSSES